MSPAPGELVGRVASLNRYPVKSMQGERLAEARLEGGGLLGDRVAAVVDVETGRVASAKRPRRWGAVFGLSARWEDGASRAGAPAAGEVVVRFPNGEAVSSRDSERVEARLGALLGREVALARAGAGDPGDATAEYHWPDMEGLVQDGRTYRDEITSWTLPAGTFFDSSGLHVLTTASLARLRRLEPGSDFHPDRFRANVVIDTGPAAAEPAGEGFAENAWVGRTLRVGSARIEVTKPCLRCVMVTLPQNGLPKDPGVLRAAFRHNEGNVGVKAEVAVPGALRVGDEVFLM